MKLYRFDTFDQRGTKLAGGIGVHAETMAEAEQSARRRMLTGEASLKFRNNDPCHQACKCGICGKQARQGGV